MGLGRIVCELDMGKVVLCSLRRSTSKGFRKFEDGWDELVVVVSSTC